MRVYGASPLYNYVELIFRSKRLFIISIVLATLIVSTLATLRGKAYTASTMVLLTGTAETGLANPDEAVLGTVQYKLNLLSVWLKDPSFMKEAIKNAYKDMNSDTRNPEHLVDNSDPNNPRYVSYDFTKKFNPDSEAFDKYCKEARQAMNYAAGQNLLELSLRWPDKDASEILKAFYWEYHDRVVAQETANTTNQTKILTELLKDYKLQEQKMEHVVADYKEKHVDEPLENQESVNTQYLGDRRALEDMGFQIRMAQEQRDAQAKQLQTMKPNILATTVYAAVNLDPAVQNAQKRKDDAQQNLDDLKKRYQDSHPKVRAAQADLDDAQANLRKAMADAKAHPTNETRTVQNNPDYLRVSAIVADADAHLTALKASYEQKAKQAEEERRRAIAAGQRNFDYKWLTDRYGLISQIRQNLENNLETAGLNSAKERKRHSDEITMVVPPIAEPESAGAKNLMLYAVGPILGLVIAFAFSLVAESLDHSLRTPIEVEKHLNKPVLAVLPRMDPPRSNRRQLGSGPDRNQATLPPV